MRIISGRLKGRKLHLIRGMAIRPTSDKVREAIFNIVSDRVRDAVVLDLFAGTGALSIEALSRGATFALFIDDSPNAISVIKKNIESFGLENQTRVIRWNIIKRKLTCIRSFSPRFNLVFMDPPYNKGLIAPTLYYLHATHSLENDACIVIEHGTEQIPEDIEVFEITDQRKYGKTLVSFLQYVI